MGIFKNRIVIGALALILGFVLAFVAVPVVNNLTTATVDVVRASRDLCVGEQITEDMLVSVEMGKVNLPKNTAYNIKDVVGMYVVSDIKADELITGSVVSSKLDTPASKIRAMRSGEYSFAINIDSAALFRLLPNDIISVYRTTEDGSTEIIPELTYISVVTTTTADDINILTENQTAADGSTLVAKKITFILQESQARALLTAKNSSTIYFVLKYRGEDQDTIDTYLAKQDSLLALGGYSTFGTVEN